MYQRHSRESLNLALGFLLTVFLPAAAIGQQAPAPKPVTPPKPASARPAATPAAKKPAETTTAPATASPEPGGKVVLRVGTHQVTQADLDFLLSRLNPQVQQNVARQGKRPVGEQYAMMVILSGQAAAHHLDASPEFQRQMALQRLQLLAQAEYEDIVDRTTVTPEDTNQYFSQHAAEFEEAQVRQVVLRKKAEGAPADTPGLPVADARARAEEIRKELLSGGDVNKVAKDYSTPNVVLIDVEPRTVRHGQLLPDLDKVVFQLKDGEVSEPVETPQVLVMVQALGRRRPELKDVSAEIENKLRQQKVDAALADLRQKNPVWMDDAYFAAPAPPATSAAPPAPEVESRPQQ
jgi:parvulin-like peptidyl-prolyl isomerase